MMMVSSFNHYICGNSSAILHIYRIPYFYQHILCNCKVMPRNLRAFLHFCAAITVQFEQDTYMVDESDGMVDVRVAASGKTSFEYTFIVTSMDLTTTSKLDRVILV